MIGPNKEQHTEVKCGVMCHDSNGAPSIYKVTIKLSAEGYEEGDHYNYAINEAMHEGYEPPYVAFDENDPAWSALHKHRDPLPDTFYIAGPMTGYPSHNFPAFDQARKQLEARGLKVLSPADIDREEHMIDPDNVVMTAELLETIIRADVDAVLACKAGIILIDGYIDSKGATAEMHLDRWACFKDNRRILLYQVEEDILTENGVHV